MTCVAIELEKSTNVGVVNTWLSENSTVTINFVLAVGSVVYIFYTEQA